MKKILFAILVTFYATSVQAEQILQSIDWTSSVEGVTIYQYDSASTEKLDGKTVLKIHTETARPFSVRLVRIERPQTSQAIYAVRGQIKYEAVSGEGMIELLSIFPGKGEFFSRTLADVGPMAKLSGTSDWRKFIVFFNAVDPTNNTILRPDQLELRVVLPNGGTVFLSPLELVEYAAGEHPLQVERLTQPNATQSQATQWWSEQTGGIIGAIGGSAIGLVAAMLSFFGMSARAKLFVFGTLSMFLIIGMFSGALGAIAIVRQQPYHVYYPLLLLGVILLLLSVGAIWVFRKKYQEAELRKMQSVDITG